MAAPVLRAASSVGTGFVATSPSSTVIGDLVVVSIWIQDTSVPDPGPLTSGFTSLVNLAIDNGTDDGLLLVTRVTATVAGAQSYTPYADLDLLGTATFNTTCVTIEVDTWDAGNITATSAAVSSTTPPDPPATGLLTGNFYVLAIGAWHITAAGATVATAPSGYSEITQNSASSHISHLSITGATVNGLSSSSTNPGAFTDNVTPTSTISATVAIGGNPVGTLTKTLDAATVSSTGTSDISGDLTKTLSTVTVSFTGTSDISGILTQTLDVVTSGPVYPATGSDFYSVTGFKAKSLYLFTELSGTVFDRAGTVDLAAINTPTFSYESKGGRLGVLADTSGDRHVNTTENEPGTGSFLYGVVATHNGVAQTDIFGYFGGATRYANIYVVTEGAGDVAWRLVSDGGAQVTHVATGLPMTSGSYPRIPHLIIAQVDRAANTARLHVKRLGTAGVSTTQTLAAHTTFTVEDAGNFGTNPGFSGGNSVHYAFVLTGSDAEGTTTPEKLAERLGWTSTAVGTADAAGAANVTLGALTTVSTATSTISGWSRGWTQTKTGVASGWDAGASSVETLAGNGYVEWIVDQNSLKMCGLSVTDPDVSYASIKYGSFVDSAFNLQVYEDGTFKETTTCAIGDVIRIRRVGTTVTYLKNSDIFYTSLTTSADALRIDTSILTPSASITQIRLLDESSGSPVDTAITWQNAVGVSNSTPRTLGAVTATATATSDITGTSTVTLGTLSLSSTATVAVSGSLDVTLGIVVMSSVIELNPQPVLIIPGQDNSRAIHFLERSEYDVSNLTVGGYIRRNKRGIPSL